MNTLRGKTLISNSPVISVSSTPFSDSLDVQVGTNGIKHQINYSTGDYIEIDNYNSRVMDWYNLYGWPLQENERYIHYSNFNNEGIPIGINHQLSIEPELFNTTITNIEIFIDTDLAVVDHEYRWASYYYYSGINFTNFIAESTI